MMKLSNIKIAALVCDGFEEVELIDPRTALEKEGAHVDLISPNPRKVKAWAHKEWGTVYDVDVPLDDADPQQYDALLLPGGVMNPDKLRTLDKAVTFVRHFFDVKKPIAAICHGPWTLIETKQIANRNMTSYHSLRTDLLNAGANWQDKAVVVDDFLITSRHPGDLPAFIEKMIEQFQKK